MDMDKPHFMSEAAETRSLQLKGRGLFNFQKKIQWLNIAQYIMIGTNFDPFYFLLDIPFQRPLPISLGFQEERQESPNLWLETKLK